MKKLFTNKIFTNKILKFKSYQLAQIFNESNNINIESSDNVTVGSLKNNNCNDKDITDKEISLSLKNNNCNDKDITDKETADRSLSSNIKTQSIENNLEIKYCCGNGCHYCVLNDINTK